MTPQQARGGSGAVTDPFSVSLEDADILEEVELTAALMVAANDAADHLSQEQIDRLLGLQKPPS